MLNKEINNVGDMLSVLQDRDDNIYRVIFEASPIPMEIRKSGTGGTEKYKALLEEKLSREDLIIGTLQKIDQLKKEMYIQTKSYDELVALSKRKAEMVSAIPAIQPIANQDLRRFASGFGYRTHPILKVSRMHTGCDFSAPTGTPVFATGDGKVITAKRSSGYGNEIEIDHGFGYITKYAHLSSFDVREGQKVKRGQQIGKVGNTGLSVAPHLHYEVMHNKNKVNPVNYFFNDLTPEEYDQMLEMASIENQSLGGGE
jgi:murein DD-endopeptidase MepM/ murein hydrolase activator NlpD